MSQLETPVIGPLAALGGVTAVLGLAGSARETGDRGATVAMTDSNRTGGEYR